jgi:hypothetical protein
MRQYSDRELTKSQFMRYIGHEICKLEKHAYRSSHDASIQDQKPKESTRVQKENRSNGTQHASQTNARRNTPLNVMLQTVRRLASTFWSNRFL